MSRKESCLGPPSVRSLRVPGGHCGSAVGPPGYLLCCLATFRVPTWWLWRGLGPKPTVISLAVAAATHLGFNGSRHSYGPRGTTSQGMHPPREWVLGVLKILL